VYLRVLTDYGEVHGVADGGRGAHLALIEPGVPPLWVANLQHPVFCLGRVDGLKPLVTRVSIAPDGQQMNVSVAHPRHLPTNGTVKLPITQPLNEPLASLLSYKSVLSNVT
jgi:hypothetical protein